MRFFRKSWLKELFLVGIASGLLFFFLSESESAQISRSKDERKQFWVDSLRFTHQAVFSQPVNRKKPLELFQEGDSLDDMIDQRAYRLCPSGKATQKEVEKQTVSLLVTTYQSPKSLRHSLMSWNQSGLLDLVTQKLLWVGTPSGGRNSLTKAEKVIGENYGFKVLFSRDSSPSSNFVNVGVEELVQNATGNLLLFVEKDFKTCVSPKILRMELETAVNLVVSGADLVRLRSKKDLGGSLAGGSVPNVCESFDKCSWEHADPWERQFAWLYAYCEDNTHTKVPSKMALCTLKDPYYSCTTSYYSNWSNNPWLMKRSTWMSSHMHALAQWKNYTKNSDFEYYMTRRYTLSNWFDNRYLICISRRGTFCHHEIDQ